MSTVRARLSAAKAAVEKKNFGLGRDECREALTIDPKSYNAYCTSNCV